MFPERGGLSPAIVGLRGRWRGELACACGMRGPSPMVKRAFCRRGPGRRAIKAGAEWQK